MTNFRSRPKDGYIFNASWEELYVLAKHWQSDLLFYKDDMRFLGNLMNKYFIWISRIETIEMVRNIEAKLAETEIKCESLLERIQLHLTHLTNLMEDAFKYDTQKFRAEHLKLENDIAEFVKDFRKNRNEVFTVTEYFIGSEEFLYRLNGQVQ